MISENPCIELGNKMFEGFGYNTDKGCDICGSKPAKIQPRFLYTTCQDHSILNPIRFSRVVSGEEQDPYTIEH